MINNKNKAFRIETLVSEILGKLDAHEKMVNLEVVAYVVRQFITENYRLNEREEATDRFCNMIRLP